MERELSRLQEAISSIQDSYGQDHLHLTVVKGYLRKLITNDRVARYLEQYQPELFVEFQKIAEMTSAGTAGEAARWGGSIAAMGMAANPSGAHQAGRVFTGRTD